VLWIAYNVLHHHSRPPIKSVEDRLPRNAVHGNDEKIVGNPQRNKREAKYPSSLGRLNNSSPKFIY